MPVEQEETGTHSCDRDGDGFGLSFGGSFYACGAVRSDSEEGMINWNTAVL
jgi:hypothetical protein